jgi:hypothetical protein
MEQEHIEGAGAPADPDPIEDAKAIAAEVIAIGGTYRNAGDIVGRSKRTIVRWMADPVFGRKVADLRAERLSEVTGRLAELAPRAVDVLSDALEDEKAWVRLRAATDVLSWSMRLRRAADLEIRMLEVERRQGIRPAADLDEGDETAEVAS